MNVKDLASQGGNARWKGKTAIEKTAHAQKMNEARWGKKLSTPKKVAKKKKEVK